MHDDRLIQLAYSSSASGLLSKDAIQALLEHSRTFNDASGITGLLLFDGLDFFQVLEGEEGAVNALYDRIADDPRHTDVTLLKRSTVEARDFANWDLAFVGVTPMDVLASPQLQAMDALSDRLSNLDGSQAGILIRSFIGDNAHLLAS